MNKSFCVLPWVSLATDTEGNIVPCCVSTQKIKKSDGTNYNFGTDNLEDIYNSQDFINLRQSMLDGELVSGCQECYDNEKYGSSQRLQFNSLYQIDDPQPITNLEPKYLDVRPGNLCNLRCRSCSPMASSQFAKETNSLQKQGMDEFHELVSGINETWYTTETFYRNLNLALNTATDIYLTGGEPSIIQSNIDMLQKLVNEDKNTDIKITISTNLTNTNLKFFDLLSNFKSVIIYASIDGYGDMQEYLRYPSSWATIESNLQYILGLGKNIQVVLTPVIQITNLNKIVDLLNYVDKLNQTFEKSIYVYPINLETPDYLDAVNLPIEYKLLCYEKIKPWLEVTKNTHFDFIKNKATTETDYSAQLEKFVRYNKLLDKNRNVSLEDVNPELVDILKEYKLW